MPNHLKSNVTLRPSCATSVHIKLSAAKINGCLVGAKCAVQLIADTANTVDGVIGGDIGRDGQSADRHGQRDTGISWVAEESKNEAVDICDLVQSTSDLVERTVLLHKDYNVLDSIVELLDRVRALVGVITMAQTMA